MGQKASRPVSTDPVSLEILRAAAMARPRDVFELGETFTWDELKTAYRTVARRVHPDKGGSKELFSIATECFQILAKEITSASTHERGHMDLKKAHDAFQATRPVMQSRHVDEGHSFQAGFNAFFEKHRRVDDEVDHGYGTDMEPSSEIREDIDIPKKLAKFDAKKFHDLFDAEVPSTKALIHKSDPEPMVLAKKLQFTEIGSGRPNDYSSDGTTERAKNALQYTDYMKAYTTSRLVHPKFKDGHVTFNTVEEYEAHRAKRTQDVFTVVEKRQMAREKRKIEKREATRLARVAENDRAAEDHHTRIAASAARLLKLQ